MTLSNDRTASAVTTNAVARAATNACTSAGVAGRGIHKNILDGYRYIVHNTAPGDRIFLFGYSRGAYTARSLAGLLGLCGVPDAERCAAAGLGVTDVAIQGMAIYRLRRGAARAERAACHVETYAVRSRRSRAAGRLGPPASGPPCVVHFIGVWDTVGALGVPVTWLNWIGARRHRFHDVRLDLHIRNACHAVAIDEGRRPFAPALWTNRPARGQNVEQDRQHGLPDVGPGHFRQWQGNIVDGDGNLHAGLEQRPESVHTRAVPQSMPDRRVAVG